MQRYCPSSVALRNRTRAEGAFQETGYNDAFVTKLDPGGSALVYSSYLGGASNIDEATGIAVGSSGDVFLAGYTSSEDFPLVSPLQDHYGGSVTDGFITRVDPSGSSLVFSTYLGGSNIDSIPGIAIDADGNSYVTGQTKSEDFPLVNPLQQANDMTSTVGDGFLAKLNGQGTELVYSTYLSGLSFDFGTAVKADGSGNAYVTGNTESYVFPHVSEHLTCREGPTQFGVFVTKANSDGSAFTCSTVIGGSLGDQGTAIAVGSGGVYIAGLAMLSLFPTTSDAFQRNKGGGIVDGFFLTVRELVSDEKCIFLPYLGR
jgi:hypothetical protein